MFHPTRPLLSLLASAALALATTGLSHADTNIERSCNAKYGTYIPGFLGSDGFVRVKVDGYENIDARFSFQARRGCGATVPNRCRERAREAAFACMAEHATTQGAIPASCTSNGVRDYSLSDMYGAMKAAACRHAKGYLGETKYQQAKAYPLKVTIRGIVSGDRGCGVDNLMSEVRSLGTINVQCD